MRGALALAERNLGRVWPNPSAGCIVVRGGEVVVRDSRDSYVRSDGRLVCALGVEGLAVIDTPDAVRANAKVQEAYLGSAVADAQAGGH